MWVSTLLVSLLLSTTIALAEYQQSGSCGCEVETFVYFNEERIPSRIKEWNCRQLGSACGLWHSRQVSLIQLLNLRGKTRQNTENKQTFDLTRKIEIFVEKARLTRI